MISNGLNIVLQQFYISEYCIIDSLQYVVRRFPFSLYFVCVIDKTITERLDIFNLSFNSKFLYDFI